MSSQYPAVDPDGLLEFSVVFTDRSLNHMSKQFQQVMRDISAGMKQTYNAAAVALVPGGGTYGMEAVARQFAGGKKCMVLRNGWFSYRWSQIFESGQIPAEEIVLKARPIAAGRQQPWAPAPLDEVLASIRQHKPDLVFAPHVETSSGIILPDSYLRAVADAVHEHGGMLVLDCIASGAVWVNMQVCAIDVLISAPQKGWSASPCSALVMFGEQAAERIKQTRSSSFACDLLKWLQIMQAYENGGHAYHATLPTDALVRFCQSMQETASHGLELLKANQWELGNRVRAMMAENGFPSVAAPGFEAPGVVVSYTDDLLVHNGKKFTDLGLQTAAGVPLMCDEPADFRTFRIGLFGLDKRLNVEQTVNSLAQAVQANRASN